MTGKATLAVFFGFSAGVWCAISAARKTRALQRANFWPSVRGTITESFLYQDPSRKNATHFRVSYEFVVGDQIRGCTPRISGDWFWSNKHQAAFVAKYVVGQEVDVFYDPRDPKRNCLDREDKSGISALWMIAGGLIALATVVVSLQWAK